MRLFFWFSILFLGQLGAQETLFEGHIYDAKTNAPIPYVNLSFLNTLKGTSTDENGHFYLDVPTSYLKKQVHLSSLGYNDTIVTAAKLHRAKRFKMAPESFALEEVVVSKKLSKAIFLNPISSYSLSSGFASSDTPWVLALYFPNIGQQEKVLDVVTIFQRPNVAFKRDSASFRLRVYDVEPGTKKPGRDILRESMVLRTDKNQEYISVDLSDLQLKMPKGGVFIGLEWLFVPSNWYTNTYEHPISKQKVVEDRFAPTFGAVFTKNQNFRAMVYGMGEWTDFVTKSKDYAENLIPAISLKVLRN